MILVGGIVLTQDPARPVVDAVAIRDGRIVAVGSAAGVHRALDTAGAREIDLKGKTLIPGLIDAAQGGTIYVRREYVAPDS